MTAGTTPFRERAEAGPAVRRPTHPGHLPPGHPARQARPGQPVRPAAARPPLRPANGTADRLARELENSVAPAVRAAELLLRQCRAEAEALGRDTVPLARLTAALGLLRQADEEVGVAARALRGGEPVPGRPVLRVYDGEDAPADPVDDTDAAARRVAGRHGLTDRETDVLRLLATGMSNRAIARALFVSESTAKFHVANIMRKLGVGRRAEAVYVAGRIGAV